MTMKALNLGIFVVFQGRLFSGQIEHYRNEHRILCKDGTYRWILDQGSVVEKNAKGAPVRVVGTHTPDFVAGSPNFRLDDLK